MQHAVPLPQGVRKPVEETEQEARDSVRMSGNSPFVSQRIEILNSESKYPHEKKPRHWVKARGRISDEGGHEAHLAALAYMSDSYFIGTVSRIHDLWRFGAPSNPKVKTSAETTDSDIAVRAEFIRKMQESEGVGHDPENKAQKPEVGMMVSLDHTIYFHEPRRFRADEWMFTEMASPWSGDGRGVVTQHIHSMDGTLIATCFQEVRLFPYQDYLANWK